MIRLNKVVQAFLCGTCFLIAGCSDGNGVPPVTQRATAFSGDYAGLLALGTGNELVPGDVITEANNWGGYYFALASNVTSVRVSITGAAGSMGGRATAAPVGRGYSI